MEAKSNPIFEYVASICAFTFLLVHAVLIGALLVVLRDIFHCRKWMETITMTYLSFKKRQIETMNFLFDHSLIMFKRFPQQTGCNSELVAAI